MRLLSWCVGVLVCLESTDGLEPYESFNLIPLHDLVFSSYLV